MTIQITGASGFVGTNISKHLIAEGHLIKNLSLRNEKWTLDSKASAIIHLAGKAHDTSNTTLDDEYFKINTGFTKILFDKFLKSDVKDFIFFSSVKAAADTVQDVLMEDVHPNPLTPYGKSKLLAEEYLLSKTLPADKRVLIVRPCMIHGPGNKGNLNLLYKMVKQGIPWPLASFENQRSFLSIDNLNYIILDLLTTPDVKSGIYNLADDESISTNKLVQIIAKTTGKKTKLLRFPSHVIKGIARIGDIAQLPLNSDRLKKLTGSYVVSNQKIKDALNIECFPVSAEEGLVKTLKSFQFNAVESGSR